VHFKNLTNIYKDPENWSKIIALDEIRQATMPFQHPLSNSYLSGAPFKIRKIAKQINTQPKTLFGERMKESIRVANSESSSDISIEELAANSNLTMKYLEQLRLDVVERLKNDPDYNPSVFVHTSQVFQKRTENTLVVFFLLSLKTTKIRNPI